MKKNLNKKKKSQSNSSSVKSEKHKVITIGLVFFIVVSLSFFLATRKSNWDIFSSEKPIQNNDGKEENIDLPKNEIGKKIYRHTPVGLEFTYPSEFRVSAMEEEDVDVILVQGEGVSSVVQIVITPSDDPGPITPPLIEESVPEILINNPIQIMLSNEINALSFLSNNEAFNGASFEVWFYFAGHVYQLSTYLTNKLLAESIVASFSFK